jgi:hypothetical protein
MLSLEPHETYLVPQTLMDHKFINPISLLPTVVLEPLLLANECLLFVYPRALTKYNINCRNFQLHLKSGEKIHTRVFVYIANTYLIYSLYESMKEVNILF